MSRVWANRPCIESLSTAKPQTMELSFLQPDGGSFQVRMMALGRNLLTKYAEGLASLGPGHSAKAYEPFPKPPIALGI